jgi:hypothetical protein
MFMSVQSVEVDIEMGAYRKSCIRWIGRFIRGNGCTWLTVCWLDTDCFMALSCSSALPVNSYVTKISLISQAFAPERLIAKIALSGSLREGQVS